MEFFSDEEKALIAARVDKEMAWAEDVVNSNDPNNPWTATAEMVMRVGRDERLNAILQSRMMYEMDLQSNYATAEKRGIDKGKKEGIKEGIKEGKIEERFAIARNLLSMNIPIEQIVIATGLSREEVEQSRVIN